MTSGVFVGALVGTMVGIAVAAVAGWLVVRRLRRPPPAVGVLTPRELEVARLLCQEGWTCARVAAVLHLSPRTAEKHRENIYAKLGITRRAQLAACMCKGSLDAGQALTGSKGVRGTHVRKSVADTSSGSADLGLA